MFCHMVGFLLSIKLEAVFNMLPINILDRIRINCINEEPKEACGFVVLNESNKLEVINAENISEDPNNHVLIDPKSQLHASLSGEIIYIYHSQRTEQPSILDYKTASDLNQKLIIYSMDSRRITYVLPDKYINKYEGINFQMGRTDCYSLVIRYFREEFGVIIPDFYSNRTIEWHKEKYDFLGNATSKLNCSSVDKEEIKENDIIVMDFGKNRVHLGIMLPNNLLLHHPMGKKSIIEPIFKYKAKIIYGVRLIK